MKMVSLRDVAPPSAADHPPVTDGKVWQLNLDQIEAQTGRILSKVLSDVSSAGSSTQPFDKGNVLFSKLRPYLNKVVLPDESGIATTELVPLRPDPEKLERAYLAYYLRSPAFVEWASNEVAGAKMPRLVMQSFWKQQIPIPHKNGKPDLEEQKRIAAILDKADGIRRKRQQALRLTDDFLRSVFLDMFGNPALKSKVKNIVKVSDAGDVQLGRQRAPKYQTGKYTAPYVRVANVYENRIDLKDVLSMDFNPSDFEKYRLEENDILLNEGQSTELVGRPAMWRNEVPDCCFQNTLVRFKAREGEVEPYYALFVFLHYLWYGTFASVSSKTSSVAHLGAARFSDMPFPLADYTKQKDFAKLADKTYRTQLGLNTLEQESTDLFASLQQRAFRGEL